MADEALKREIDEYVERVWPDAIEDMRSLISIRSVEDRDHAAEGMPWGPESRRALDCALGIASRLGLETHDCEGYLGYADLPGTSSAQIATIAHTDVVPEGIGWSFDPFDLTRKDGYLIGRGIVDDKGPCVLSLYAARFFKERGEELPYTLRCIIGNDEETNMGDIPYYQARYPEPAFLFTPDAEFPVCNGEKGHFGGTFVSPRIAGGGIVEMDGGTVPNAIPGIATAVVRADASALPAAEGIEVAPAGEGLARITAHGKPGHASIPAGTVNAIGLLVDYLLDGTVVSDAERTFLLLEHAILSSTDGSTLGIATADEKFGPLTCIGGTIRSEAGRFEQTIDSRYPTSTTGDELAARLTGLAGRYGAAFEVADDSVPFYVDPTSPEIETLVATYNEYAGRDSRPFTIGGGTYARHFANAASFGPNDESEPKPAWVGGEHGADEGIGEECLRRALRIYICAIARLMRLDLAGK
ncbi:MAG: Sapep family Mn(2+)-dependent dipeptidase [Atopobiaceae bacterium]|jgi:succinyl-diaminopimelate desuccinylase